MQGDNTIVMDGAKQMKRLIGLFIIVAFVLVSQTSVSGLKLQEELLPDEMPGPVAIIYYDPNPQEIKHFSPPLTFLMVATPTADIQVNYNGSGWTTEAQNAFEYAVSIWETLIESNVVIVVDADFSSLGTGVLGGAGTTTIHRNFPGARFSDTWYSAALASTISGSDLNGNEAEISASFNNNINISNIDWYYGTDGNTPSNLIDFVSVVLHEIGHGLGFFGSMTKSGLVGSWGMYGLPTVYDLFTENGSGQSLLNDFANGSVALGNQLTNNNVYFDGPKANAANGNSRVQLYAPSSWQQGSSYSHLGESFNGTSSALMTYAIGSGETEHSPGPVNLGLFEDLGWNTVSPPEIEALPSQFVAAGETIDNAIDLWAFTEDIEDADDELTYQIISQSDPIGGVSIDSNRYVDINPTNPSWNGRSAVTIRVTDPEGKSTDGVFMINPVQVYLPAIINQ